jgi:hypothetical protein
MVTPLPEVIQSKPPVTIQHIAEGPNPWWAFWGTVGLAGAALTVALITLWQVCRQIVLARFQIRIAVHQLKLAYRELHAVREHLKIASEMKALFPAGSKTDLELANADHNKCIYWKPTRSVPCSNVARGNSEYGFEDGEGSDGKVIVPARLFIGVDEGRQRKPFGPNAGRGGIVCNRR